MHRIGATDARTVKAASVSSPWGKRYTRVERAPWLGRSAQWETTSLCTVRGPSRQKNNIALDNAPVRAWPKGVQDGRSGPPVESASEHGWNSERKRQPGLLKGSTGTFARVEVVMRTAMSMLRLGWAFGFPLGKGLETTILKYWMLRSIEGALLPADSHIP